MTAKRTWSEKAADYKNRAVRTRAEASAPGAEGIRDAMLTVASEYERLAKTCSQMAALEKPRES